MEKDKKKNYYDEEKVWTKRKPKIKTKEQIEEELIEKKNNKKNNIIKGILYVIVTIITISIIFIQVRTVEETDLKGIKILKDTELRTEILNEKTKNKEYMKNIEDIEKKIEQYKKSGTSGEKVPDILEKELEELKDGWGKGSFSDKEATIKYHYNKHKEEVGADSLLQYLRKAKAFSKNLRRAKKRKVTGATKGDIKYEKMVNI